MTTTTEKRRRCLTDDSPNELEEDNGEILNANPQLTTKRRVSATADIAAHRLIVSERRQLAVLKQLTASDETSVSPSSVIAQPRSTKVFRRNEHGETIVHIAARKGDLKRLRKALKDGANVNEEDNAGWTPLHEAVTKNQYRAANLLLKSGANANAPGPEGQTPLTDAVLNNNIKIVGLLLNYSADTSMIDQTRLNEPMIQVLKGEMTNFDLSDTENDDQSLSPTSDESEQEDKNLSESSSSYTSKFQTKKSSEHSSIHNQPSTPENEQARKNPYDFESDDEHETKQSPASNDSHEEQEQNYRVPPLRIILARTALPNSESNISSIMDDHSIAESTSLPIIEENEKFLSTITTSTELNEKIVTQEEEQTANDKKQEESFPLLADKNNSSPSNPDSDRSQSPETIVSSIMDNLLTQIEANRNSSGEENVIKREKQGDVKQPTRTLRSHARGKSNSSVNNSNENRRVSNRRRILENYPSFEHYEKPPSRKKTISERWSNNETSSHSDDQTNENHPNKIFTLKTSIIDRISSNDETNNSGDGDDDSNSAKPIHSHPDIDSLPPNKRRLRERNAGTLSSMETSNTTEENIPVETTITRDIPPNSIKQFLEIRQQINKRHEAMLNEFVLPKIPKDFAETLMMKKNYLIAPPYRSFSITTPASLGIQRLNSPMDLDLHLSDVFTRQEDERYRMKLRHQVEREKLILSHEQEILRLYGNATRSSINQEIPFSYCSLLKDNEVYNNPSIQERPASLIPNDYTELGKRGKHRWNGRSFLKWLDDSNLKYKRLSCEINQRQHLEANTLYSMQRMVWLKHIPKETSSSGRMNSLLSERYLPKVEINANFWTHWEGSSI